MIWCQRLTRLLLRESLPTRDPYFAKLEFRVSSHSARFKELVGTDIDVETMEEKITLAAGRKDREVQEAETGYAAANRNLSQLQTSYNIAKKTLKEKNDELSRLEKQLRDGLKESGKNNVDEAIKEAETEIKIVREWVVASRKTERRKGWLETDGYMLVSLTRKNRRRRFGNRCWTRLSLRINVWRVIERFTKRKPKSSRRM